jgi:hypothetical protein
MAQLNTHITPLRDVLINPRYLYATRDIDHYVISNTEVKPNLLNVVLIFDLLNEYRVLRAVVDLVKTVCRIMKTLGAVNRHNWNRQLHNQFVGKEADIKYFMNSAIASLFKVDQDVYMLDSDDKIIPWYQGSIRDATSQERDATSQERDATSQERDATSQERDATSQERDATSQEPCKVPALKRIGDDTEQLYADKSSDKVKLEGFRLM